MCFLVILQRFHQVNNRVTNYPIRWMGSVPARVLCVWVATKRINTTNKFSTYKPTVSISMSKSFRRNPLDKTYNMIGPRVSLRKPALNTRTSRNYQKRLLVLLSLSHSHQVVEFTYPIHIITGLRQEFTIHYSIHGFLWELVIYYLNHRCLKNLFDGAFDPSTL